jgi:putative sigma-54 modulation protein
VRIELTTRGFTVTPGLRAHVERRLAFALDRWGERIARARVVLADVNGPKGGADKACRVELRLRGAGGVRATARDVDAYAAIDAAAHRAARALSRALDRERSATLELLWLARALTRRPDPA